MTAFSGALVAAASAYFPDTAFAFGAIPSHLYRLPVALLPLLHPFPKVYIPDQARGEVGIEVEPP